MLAGGAAADDFADCQRLLQKTADKHLDEANDIRRKHEKSLKKQFDKFLDRYGDIVDRESLDASIQAIHERHEIDKVRQEYVDGVVATLRTFEKPEDEAFNCPSKGTLRYRSENWNKNYEYQLELLRQAISDRLEMETMEEDEGLAIIAFYAIGLAQEIRINRRGSILGNVQFGPVTDGEYFRIMKLKAGTYFWDRISRDTIIGTFYHDYSKRGFEFHVEPGKLNYTGVFVYDSDGQRARGSHNDRTAIVITMLEQRYPELLDRFELVNGLVPDDPFIDYYLEEKLRHAQSVVETR